MCGFGWSYSEYTDMSRQGAKGNFHTWVMSNTPARRAVNVTQKFAVRRTRSEVRETDCARNFFFVLIYCHLSKLSVGQTPRLCNLPSKSYSNNINVPYTGGNNLVKGIGQTV